MAPLQKREKFLIVNGDWFLLCALAALSFFCFYPGLLSADSLDQLNQAITGHYDDFHPPLLAFEMSFFAPARFAGAGILFLNIAGLALSVGFLARFLFSNPKRRFAVILLFWFFPPVWTMAGTIWTDTAFAIALLGVVTILMGAQRSSRPRLHLGFAAVLLVYAAAMRFNSPPALAPLCLWWGLAACRSRPRGIAAGTGLFIAVSGMALAITSAIILGTRTFPSQLFKIHDLAAISVEIGQDVLPPYVIAKGWTVEKIKTLYRSEDVTDLIWDSQFIPTRDPKEIEVLDELWLTQIRKHPSAFFKHRWEVGRGILAMGPQSCLPFQDKVEPNPLGVRHRDNKVFDLTMPWLVRSQNAIWFRGWPFVLATFLLIGAAAVMGPTPANPLLWIATSGFLYFLGLVAGAPSCEFRYCYWTVLASMAGMMCLASAVLFGDRGTWQNRRRE